MSKKRVGDYELVRKLGSGSFATVFKAQHFKYSDKIVAVKAISTNKLNAKLQENLETEIGILDKLSHPNIVRLYGIHKSPRHIYLFMEYCNGGDLHRFIRKNTRLSQDTSRQFMSQITKGMSYLWSKNLIHRDLKPQNILLTIRANTASLKIADFGFARHLAVAAMAETLCGSPLYMAPEILRFQKYDAKADLWSAGTILFEMLTGKPPFVGANPQELLRNIEQNELRFPQDIEIEQSGIDLLRQLLRRNPVERITFEEFFTSPFLSSAAEGNPNEEEEDNLKLKTVKSSPPQVPAPLPASREFRFVDGETETDSSKSDGGTTNTSSSGIVSISRSASTSPSVVEFETQSQQKETGDEAWEIVSSHVSDLLSSNKPSRGPQSPPSPPSARSHPKTALLHVLRYAGELGDLGRELANVAVELKKDGARLDKVETEVKAGLGCELNVDLGLGSEGEIGLRSNSACFAVLSKAVDIVEYAILAGESVFFAGGSTREAADAICADLQTVLKNTRGIRRMYYDRMKPLKSGSMNSILLRTALALGKLGATTEADLDVSNKELSAGSMRNIVNNYKQGLTVMQSLAAEPDLSAEDAKIVRGYIAMLLLRIQSLSFDPALDGSSAKR